MFAFANTSRSIFLILIFLLSKGQSSALGDEGTAESFLSKVTNSEIHADEWYTVGRDFREQRYSPLSQINSENISTLGLAWYVDLPREGGQESTPLVIDGIMYFSTAWSVVYALNAVSGEVIWKFDPEVPRVTQVKGCCGAVNRGVAYWNDKIFVGAYDGRLIALDAKTGEQVWSRNTLDGNRFQSASNSYTITGAPRIASNNIVIGNGGGEYGVRGYVSAYDADSGQLSWRFYTVPGDPSKPFEHPALEMAAKTWHGEWWKVGGGGTAWDSMAYDPELNLFYIGVGNSSPWNPNIRSLGKGDNLFVSSIVAVNADTGRYVWHYQTTPGDGWDYTATQHMILADLIIEGRLRKVLMQAPKNGFFYVIDRETGELISAEPYVGITWASHIDKLSGKPVINPNAQYWITGKTSVQIPSPGGAHNWHPMSYSPQTGLVYLPAAQMPGGYTANDQETYKAFGRNTGMSYKGRIIPKNPKFMKNIAKNFKGWVLAWDPKTNKEAWRVEQKYPGTSGMLSTAGNLIFHGTLDEKFRALDADNGTTLWETEVQTPVMAAPMSYQLDGVQYVAVLVGRGGAYIGGRTTGDFGPGASLINRSRLLVYRLGGGLSLPVPEEDVYTLTDLSEHVVDGSKVEKGAPEFAKHCFGCHGAAAVGNSVVPDLRFSPILADPDLWREVVHDGVLEENGMASFAPVLSVEEIEAVRHYVMQQNLDSEKYGDTTRIGR